MRLAEVLANGETVPAGKLLDPEVGFEDIIQGFPRNPFLDSLLFVDDQEGVAAIIRQGAKPSC